MVHKAGDLVRINPEYYANNERELFSSIRRRGPDYVYTVKTASLHALTLLEEDCSWTNSLTYLVPAHEIADTDDAINLDGLL